jgi:hypothetical protein
MCAGWILSLFLELAAAALLGTALWCHYPIFRFAG